MSNLINESSPLNWEWLVTPHKAPEFMWVTVTPEQSQRIVDELNQANRPIREGRVEFWQRTMNMGRWGFTHQGVAFTTVETTDGDFVVQVQDGQHRFLAAVRENLTMELLVAVGMPNKNFGIIDVGAPRSGSDTLAIMAKDEDYKEIFAGVNRMVHNGTVRHVKLVELYRSQARLAAHKFKLTNDETKDYALEYGIKLSDCVNRAETIRKLRDAPSMSSIALATAIYLIRQNLSTDEDNAKFEEFLRGYSEGTMLTRGDSRVPLRSYMQNLRDSHNRKVPVLSQLAVFIKAWNKFALGEASQVLWFRNEEMFPLPEQPRPGKLNEYVEGSFVNTAV